MIFMDKNEIYKIIGYKGEYNINVKKRIRKLLKERGISAKELMLLTLDENGEIYLIEKEN